jgi:predicted lipoprotein
MNKKIIGYFLLICMAGLLAYKAVYFKKLDQVKLNTQQNAKPADFAQAFWLNKFTPYLDSAIEVTSFLKSVQENSTIAFQKYSHSQGIGNASYFLLKGEGIVKKINEHTIELAVKSGVEEITILLNTGIYFGNAVRDVTGLISMSDFNNTIDYNDASAQLNKIVQTQIVLPLKKSAAMGASIQFVGCAEINKEKINTNEITLLPVKIIIK